MAAVSFCVVGCGHAGTRHAEHMSRLGRLASACDIDNAALMRFAAAFPRVTLYSSLEKLLAKDTTSQVLSVCTPNGLHAQHAIHGLQAGKHVICEKPLALSSQEARQMVQAAALSERRLFPVAQNRFNPPVLAVKQLLEDGHLGKILSAEINCFWNRDDRYYRESPWRGTRSMDGGILYTQFSHFLDLCLLFLGEVKSASGTAANLRHQATIEFEDTLLAVIEFESGVLATLNCTLNAHKCNMEGSIALFGDRGTVKIGGQYLNVLEYQQVDADPIHEVGVSRPPNDYGHYQGSMSNHDRVIENVIDVLQEGARPTVTAHEAAKTIEMIEGIYRAVTRQPAHTTGHRMSTVGSETYGLRAR